MAGQGTVRFAASRTRQPNTETPPPEETELMPPPEETELMPPLNPTENDDTPEGVPTEKVDPSEPSGTTVNPFDYGTRQGSNVPSSPYIAGLSYMMTPQPFRVPIPDRFYYPCPHFVRRCPYYPKGFYWGADWNRRFLPPNNLIHGNFRFNPYLSNHKAQKHGARGGHSGNRCPKVVAQAHTASATTSQPMASGGRKPPVHSASATTSR
ncbi:MAG TPA: hypothetical protein VMV69_16560 [Pirellulales bacterium]|nr:hypothetical protein [Pirellulales bacterium]